MVDEKLYNDKVSLDAPVFEDYRGIIQRHLIGGVKFNALTTKPGVFRSGDVHKTLTQFDLILKGEFEITLRQDSKDVVMIKKANELIVIPPGTPHLFKSLTDTVLLEWWDGPFECEYYRPYRDIVDQNYSEMKDKL